MKVADVLSMSWGNLDRRKGRTALTCAGVVIGVSALVLMVSLGLGLERQVEGTLGSEFSLRTITVNRAKSGEKKKKRSLWDMGSSFAPLTDEDFADMETIPGVSLAQPYLYLWLEVSIERGPEDTGSSPFEIGGVRPEELEIYGKFLVAGKMWSSSERSCIIPVGLAESLFENPDPEGFIGKQVILSNPMNRTEGEIPEELKFTITGVIDAAKLSLLHGNRVFLPMERAKEVRKFTKGGMVPMLYSEGSYFQAEVRADGVRIASEVASRLENSGYRAVSVGDILDMVNVLFLVFEGFLACIGAIGLIVSLFGIANTMAMAVLERTREIGIMKALGARNRDISRVFLFEAGALGAMGGIVGVALAVVIGFLLNAIAAGVLDLESDVKLFHTPIWLAVGAIVFSMFVSVLAGTLPARRAARMEPVAALRYE